MPFQTHMIFAALASWLVFSGLPGLRAEDKPAPAPAPVSAPAANGEPVKYRIIGLCCREREPDLRLAAKALPDIQLANVDFENGEVALAYDAAKLFAKLTPEKILERLNDQLRNASHSTFELKPLSTVPKENLQQIEIPVTGLDCKGCCLGAYYVIYKIEGVERATVSFKEGRVVALIDSTKTNRAALEDALKKKEVKLKLPEAKEEPKKP